MNGTSNATKSPDREALSEAVTRAEAEVARLRDEQAEIAERVRAEPRATRREAVRGAAEKLAAAKDRLDRARVALAVFERTGQVHDLIVEEGRVVGTMAIAIPPGTTQPDRERVIDESLASALDQAADTLGVVLAAKPTSFTRERPGRDAEGRTVFEVAGRVEGDRLLPAVSRASKTLRRT